MIAVAPAARKFIKPPALKMLPQGARTSSLVLSTVLHALLIVAFAWAPLLFPSPTIIDIRNDKIGLASEYEPLVMPRLPQLEARASGSTKASAQGAGSWPAYLTAPQPRKRNYAGPQEIVSEFPNAVNRVQTIRRPDLVAPPELKFPLRLQSMITLPTPAAPILAAPPREQPKQTPSAVEVPIAEATVPQPLLVSTQKRISVARTEEVAPPSVAAPQSSASDLAILAQPHAKPPKAVVVVNAVNVPPDPAASIPDAQLAGNFVIGPSVDSATEKSAAAGTGRSAEDAASNSGKLSSGPSVEVGTGTGSGHVPGATAGSRATAGTGATSGKGTGAGGTGIGVPPANGVGNNAGTPGIGRGPNGGSGISISGGVPGRNGAAITRALPLRRSYGITIIAGGSSGGASRDTGVFDRNETVFSVAIPMADAGGGPDWPMQYALLKPAQSSALLVPPFVQKKVGATMARAEMGGDSGPVFVSGIIDETGQLQSLRTIRAQDSRSQPALHALQQWTFLPAQLDGNPVACKVLIGVTVIAAEQQN
ncbi:MAG TPA: energy transducer TonB [Candidatus Angelobacter sp.]|jgi:hypothetical protein